MVDPRSPSEPPAAYTPKSHSLDLIAICAGAALLVAAIVFIVIALLPPALPEHPIDGDAATAEIRSFDGNYTRAITRYQTAVAATPNDPHAHYLLGRAYFAAGDYNAALPVFRQALDLSPNDAELLYYVTRTRYRLADHHNIRADLERVLELDPSHAEAHHFLGGLYLFENLALAQLHINEAIRLAPENDKLYHNRGIIFYQLHDYRRAIADLTRALRTNDQIANMLFWRGAAYRALGDYQSALTDLDQSVRLDPGDPRAQIELAYAYTNVGDRQRSAQILDEILERNPANAQARFERSLVRYELGDYRVAIADVDTLLEQGGSWERDYRLWATRGVARFQLGDPEGAFAPDSTTLATGDVQGRVRLWRVVDGAHLVTLRKHYQSVTAVQFSPDSQFLATASTDGAIRLWDLSSGEARESEGYLHPTTGLTMNAYSLAFTPDGAGLLLGLGDGAIVIRSINTGRDSLWVPAHEGPVIGLTVSPDGGTLASTGDQRVRLWHMADHSTAGEIALTDSATGGARFSPDGRMLAVAADQSVTLWATDDGRPVARLSAGAMLQDVAFAPDGQTIIAAPYRAELPIWQIEPVAPGR